MGIAVERRQCVVDGCRFASWKRGLCAQHQTESGSLRTSSYPPNAELLELARGKSWSQLAGALGIRRESLRDYVKIRPELDAALREAIGPSRLSLEEKAQRRRESSARYRRTHRAERVAQQKRRVRKMTGVERQELEEYAVLVATDPCVFCGSPSAELDHIVPLASGGSPTWENIAPTCASCNRRKRTIPLLQFMLRSVSNV